jgi:phage pi2 protein 07
MPQLKNKLKYQRLINLDILIRMNNIKIKKDVQKDHYIKDILNNNQ